jgi:pimeloyl-ACP methyl ester carboxylesterase
MSSQSCVNLTLSIKLDRYPHETSWKIKNNLGTILYSGGNYLTSQQYQTVTTNICLVQGQSYIFEIFDTYGDGICCGFGSGSYSLDYGGLSLFTGGTFTSSKTHNFCFNCFSGPVVTSCSDGIKNGLETGIDCGGTACRPCPGQSSGPNASIEIQLDRYPLETSWQLLNGSTIIASGSGYNAQDLYINTNVTLLQGQNYTFRIFDSYGDGICCKLNGTPGYYKVSANGVNYVSNNDFRSNSAEHNFCFNCSSNYSTCSDGIKNGSETGIDCGGTSCSPCNTQSYNGLRKIVFTHGFAGSETTWVKMNEVHSKNFTGVIPNWPNRWTDSRSTAYNEWSLNDASESALVQIKDKMVEMNAGNPTDANGIVIAHSMGGVVVRDMDRKYDQYPSLYGPKPYGGIITFGSPHGGSPIANSIVGGSVTNYISKLCPFLGNQADKIANDFSILNLANKVYELFKGNSFGGSINSLCTDKLTSAVGALANQRGIVIDAQVGSSKMQNLYTAPNIRKISLIGIEDQPVELKYASSFMSGNTAYYFEDNIDSKVENDVNYIAILLGIHMSNLSLHQYNAYNAIKNLRDKLLNLNRDVMGLTGAIQLNPIFSGQCQVDTYHYGNLQSNEIKNVSTPQQCDQYNYSVGSTFGGPYDVVSTPLYNSYNLITTAHDGLIPSYSQEAWPGATKLYMNGSNHSQMKNDANTRNYLRNIYDGSPNFQIDPWWKIDIKY